MSPNKSLFIELVVFSDCRNIVSRFVEKNRTDYKSFCEVWNEMNFYNVFTPSTNKAEILQMTKVLFHYGKRTFCLRHVNHKKLNTGDTDDEQVILQRIGALFLMYTIFYKQPFKHYVKIDTSLATWREMKEFMDNSLPMIDKYDEARYTFWKLFADGAFNFTACDFYVGLDKIANYDQIHESQKQHTTLAEDIAYGMKEYSQNSSELPALLRLEEKYNEGKRKLIQKYKLNKMALPMSDVFTEMSQCLSRMQAIVESRGAQAHTRSSSVKSQPRLKKLRSSKRRSSRRQIKKPKSTTKESEDETAKSGDDDTESE